MIAIKRLKNILWILIVAFGALTAYLISLRVATERNAVQALDRRIAHVRGDIRYLETEFEARANMRQLERWNADDYRYVVPKATQYLPDERSLASLDGVETNGELYVAPPVMMAMAESPDAASDVPVSHPQSPASVQIRADDVVLRAASATPMAAIVERGVAPSMRTAVAETRGISKSLPLRSARTDKVTTMPDPVARKVARMALLDAKLLDDGTLRDLGARADVEQRTRGH
jgi:hypothetical protein